MAVIRKEHILDASFLVELNKGLGQQLGKLNAVRPGVYLLHQKETKKHRCPNCGATKIESENCEYCGT